MIVYSNTKIGFIYDSFNGVISSKIDSLFEKLGIRKESQSELNSWKNSLDKMSIIIQDNRIDNDVEVAIEFQIPLTSKRVDFMIGGCNNNQDHIVVIELKQWDKCIATSRDCVVNAYTGGANRDVAHPSQQAYSYAKIIENFNESIQEEKIELNPCAYLHNYESKYKDQICHNHYGEIIKLAPVFLMEDAGKLREFITKFVTKPSNKKLFEIIDYGKIKPSKSLQSVVGSILNGNDEFTLIDEQLVAYSTILKLVQMSLNSNQKHTVIVEGGPGTGKSVIAINLLAKILNNGYSCFYVTKNSAPRTTFSSTLVKGKYTLSYLKRLFVGSGSFINTPNNSFDCLLCDEAHRLNEKSGMFSNMGENQVKEIINASKVSVFFIDEDQRISSKDIGTIDEIKRWANILGSKVHFSDSLRLTSQFRCNGSDSYLAFLDDLLEIRQTANNHFFDLEYDVKVFDSPTLMKNELRKKNINNKSRMIAGYCYSWVSQKDKSQYDIILKDDFKAQWNFTTDRFALDEGSFEQVGCIHSTQGLEFDYVGIIIGKDLRYEHGRVITDKSKRDKRDATMNGLKYKDDVADRIIRNTYRTLLSRGQKGCYIYCEDEALNEYIKTRLNEVINNGDRIHG